MPGRDRIASKLPLAFDPVQLLAALEQVPGPLWTRHFNPADFDGDWRGVALRSSDGRPETIYPDPAAASFADTRLLRDCPYFRAVLDSFHCPLTSARLLTLGSGSVIREHRDHQLALEDGCARLHVPIQTSDRVDFRLAGSRIEMRAGECWYLNLSLPHAVRNRSTSDRIHLVIDCIVNPWLLEQLAGASPPDRITLRPSGDEEDDFDAFRARVLGDVDLQRELREAADRPSFDLALVRLAADLGWAFTTADIDAALRTGRRTWSERSQV